MDFGSALSKPFFTYASIALLVAAGAAQVNVTTQHNDRERTGSNIQEAALSHARVNARSFGRLAKHAVDDQVYSQPLVATNVRLQDRSFGTGTHDLVFVTTVNNSVYAFDANVPGDAPPVWHVNFGAPPNLYDGKFGCFDMNGNIGIVGTPVIDAERGVLYVVALTRVGNGYEQRLHALDVATGADLEHSPAVVAAPGFDALLQNQRPALMLANDTVYIGYASHCDKGPYHGFLLGYDARTLEQTAVLNTSPTGNGASIWQSGQAPAADADGNVYIVTGNGTWNGKTDFSETFMKLDPKLKLLDWFTPSNHEVLDEKDNDIDSSGATLIPGTTSLVGGGKEGVLYTLDSTSLGHLGDEHAIQHFQATSSHLHSLVYWDSAKHGPLLYIWGQRDKARVYKVAGGKVAETPFMMRPTANEGHPGAMLSLSANGKSDGILWAAIHASGDSWHETRPGILHAYDADDISHELWNSWQIRPRDDCDGYSKMAPPTIANGQVYLASFGKQNIGTGGLCVYGLLPGGTATAAPEGLAAKVEDGSVALTWNALPGARSYSVLAANKPTGEFRILATGLTTPSYSGIQAPPGKSFYVVRAAGVGGVSKSSKVAEVEIKDPTALERMH